MKCDGIYLHLHLHFQTPNRIITEEDCDRVWESVANGITMMMQEEENEQSDDVSRTTGREENGYV